MKVSGTHTVAVPRQRLWDALHDPALLEHALPGCSKLECPRPGCYAMTVAIDVSCVEGTYHGDVEVVERDAPSSVTLAVAAAGEPGSGRGTVTVDLDDADGGTQVRYELDAEVGGAIANVGQRLLASVVQRTVADHLDAVERALAGDATPAATATSPASPVPGPEPDVASSQGPEQRQDTPSATRTLAPMELGGKEVLTMVAIGSALVGYLVGRRSRR